MPTAMTSYSMGSSLLPIRNLPVDARQLLTVLYAGACVRETTTDTYRLLGTDTLAYGDQKCWIRLNAMKGYLESATAERYIPQPSDEATAEAKDAKATQYASLLDAIEPPVARPAPSPQEYALQIHHWAQAFEREVPPVPSDSAEALYGDTALDQWAEHEEHR